jgi:hypothetical protein
MNKQELERTTKATYKGKDIFTLKGSTVFNGDIEKAPGCLSNLAFGAFEGVPA